MGQRWLENQAEGGQHPLSDPGLGVGSEFPESRDISPHSEVQKKPGARCRPAGRWSRDAPPVDSPGKKLRAQEEPRPPPAELDPGDSAPRGPGARPQPPHPPAGLLSYKWEIC